MNQPNPIPGITEFAKMLRVITGVTFVATLLAHFYGLFTTVWIYQHDAVFYSGLVGVVFLVAMVCLPWARPTRDEYLGLIALVLYALANYVVMGVGNPVDWFIRISPRVPLAVFAALWMALSGAAFTVCHSVARGRSSST